MSEVQVSYIVKQAFTYGGKHLKPGDAFIPVGGKFDEQIIKMQRLVRTDTSAIKAASLKMKAKNHRRDHAGGGKRRSGGNSKTEPERERSGEAPAAPALVE